MARPAAQRPNRAKGKAPPTADRKLYFYRANAGRTKAGEPKTVPASKLLKRLAKLPWEDTYWTLPDGNAVNAWVDSLGDTLRMQLATVRRSGLPLLDDAGRRSPLAIATTAGLCEAVHIVFFPNNLVGVEFNFYGPRPSRLPSYLRRVLGDDRVPAFTLDPLLRRDVTAQLDRMRHLRVLDLTVRAAYAETIAQADQDLGAAFVAARNVGAPHIVHLELRPEPYRRDQWLGSKLLSGVRNLATRDDLRENTSRFIVRGLNVDERVEEIDLLKDHLVSSKKIVRLDHRSRALNDQAAYAAIEEAHAELKYDLELAASAAID